MVNQSLFLPNYTHHRLICPSYWDGMSCTVVHLTGLVLSAELTFNMNPCEVVAWSQDSYECDKDSLSWCCTYYYTWYCIAENFQTRNLSWILSFEWFRQEYIFIIYSYYILVIPLYCLLNSAFFSTFRGTPVDHWNPPWLIFGVGVGGGGGGIEMCVFGEIIACDHVF